MANCEKCIHLKVCLEFSKIAGVMPEELEEHVKKEQKKQCEHYKDKSLIFELPCKVDDTVYKVIERCLLPAHICVFNGGYGASRCCVKPCGAYIEEIKFSANMVDLVGKSIFLRREEAERVLKGK